ncbi:hypothetical protein [Prevotella sp.]|uniref:hypothetical protein n=1 Tax=Prevotella sp. TaxID=59823 RepID=UPI002F91E5DA
MKKMMMTLVALLSMTMSYAADENANNANANAAYDMTVNYNSLSYALNLSSDQLESVKDVHRTFCVEMMNAANAPKEDKAQLVNKAVVKDLKYMHFILDKDQYRKYVMLLNATMNNRGLK